MAYYVIGYKKLFGYNLWGTLWRQGFVLFCGLLTLLLVTILAFPDLFMPKPADDNSAIIGYIIGAISFTIVPLIILVIGHVINLIATRKYRKEYKKASTRENT